MWTTCKRHFIMSAGFEKSKKFWGSNTYNDTKNVKDQHSREIRTLFGMEGLKYPYHRISW